MNIFDHSSADSPLDTEELHEREAIIEHVVQTGAIGGQAKSLRLADIDEMGAADRLKEITRTASMSLK